MKKTLLALAAVVAMNSAFALGPNTSADPSTPAFTNGTLSGQTNVSGINVHSLLYSGNTTKVLVHWIPWFTGGNDSGIDVNYSTSDPTYVGNFIADLQRRGVDGVIVDWMGQSDITNSGALQLQSSILGKTSNGTQMKYAIMLDAQLLGNYSGTTNQTRLTSALNYISSQYLNDTDYLTYNSKVVVFDFGLTGDISGYGTGTINWGTIASNYPNIQIVHLDNATSPDGFKISNSAGSFLWVNPSTSGGSFSSDQTNYYTRAQTSGDGLGKIAVGSVYKGFSNIGTDGTNFAPWDGSTRTYIDQNCGQTWLTSFANINSKYSSTNQLPFVQVVTWDDYYEGTPTETAIDNCLQATAVSHSGSRGLDISYPGGGNINTLYDVEIWYSSNGGATYSMQSVVASGTTFVPLSIAGTYRVKFIGKPFIKNTDVVGIVVH